MSIYGDRVKRMLPKTYDRKHVAHEINIALVHFKHLEPVIDRYVYNDGTTKNLMSLNGTLPVRYQEKIYNIPVCIWIEESYPETAPICYVTPTREMVVLRGDYISSNGEVLLPYLDEWKKGHCDLVSLLQVLVAMFGDFPPVCMQSLPEPKQTSCCLQFHREAEVLSNMDGSLYMNLAQDGGPAFQQENETNC